MAPLLNTAGKVYVGNSVADKVYVGSNMVWQNAIPLTPTINLGDNVYGGYAAGVIDTTLGNIVPGDASTTGAKYLLVVSPKSLERSLAYRTSAGLAPTAAGTRWNGLAATTAMNSSTYPAAQYCYNLTYPSDGHSRWYLPAMDELEVIYRNLKPRSTTNNTFVRSDHDFPPTSQACGYNPSSSPPGAAYSGSTPSQTPIADFQAGGTQAVGDFWAISSTRAYISGFYQAWAENFGGDSSDGNQWPYNPTYALTVRPVRRVLL